MSQVGLLLVTLSVVEGSRADWLRSFGYAQDDRVLAQDDRVLAQDDRVWARDDMSNFSPYSRSNCM